MTSEDRDETVFTWTCTCCVGSEETANCISFSAASESSCAAHHPDETEKNEQIIVCIPSSSFTSLLGAAAVTSVDRWKVILRLFPAHGVRRQCYSTRVIVPRRLRKIADNRKPITAMIRLSIAQTEGTTCGSLFTNTKFAQGKRKQHKFRLGASFTNRSKLSKNFLSLPWDYTLSESQQSANTILWNSRDERHLSGIVCLF